jgi:hypothetical protein
MTGALDLLQDLLQTAALKTNRVFPFSVLNRAPYWLAIDCFLRVCRKFPEIRGVYLRHGMAEGNWVPGISDIDLTVTLQAGLSTEDEFRCLTALREKHAGLRRVFPMLTDIAILREDHLDAWTRFGIQGFEAARWKPLLGTRPCCGRRGPADSRDAVDDALYRFFDRMLAWYFEPGPFSYLRLQRMKRVAARIFRHAPVRFCEAGDPARLVAHVLVELDRWIGDTENRAGDETEEEAVMVRGEVCLVVPGGHPDEETVAECLHRIRDRAGNGMRIRVATIRMLRYWLQIWRPQQHHDWVTGAKTVRGPNVLEHIGPGTEGAFVRSLLNTVSSVLPLPRFSAFAAEAFRSLAVRGWSLRLYLEKGIHFARPAETMRELRRHYPASVEKLAKIQALPVLSFRAFSLLRETAAAVARAAPV